MERLVDLLNHGILPFTGREAEVERILSFWRGTFEAHELRTALLVGEAGIGKSRLLDQAIPRITDAGGAVIHARLFPESTSSIVPLIAQGLWYSEIARRLLRTEPEETLAGVAGALRRVARLRPTILVLEDLHLLAGDPLRDFALLLEALAEESLSLLCTARPVELPARPALERFLADEITLGGLEGDTIAALWMRLFDALPDRELLERLSEATAGNPLAIRSVLRGAIRGKTLVQDQATSIWRTTLQGVELGRSLRRNVDLLAEGMAAHLSDEERSAAATLATLGEVFARETAEHLLPDAARVIAALTFKGIVVRAATAVPALGERSVPGTPLAFTHTLLHQYMVAAAAPPAARLIPAIGAGLPLYSTLPFTLLLGAPLEEIPSGELASAVHRAIGISFDLDKSADWQLAGGVLDAAGHFLEAARESIDTEAHLELRLQILNRKLSWLRRAIDGEEFKARLAEMLELTEVPSRALLNYRLQALHHLHLSSALGSYERCGQVWSQVEALIGDASWLVGSETYLFYLEEAARAAQRLPDLPMMRLVERRLDMILSMPDLPPALRAIALKRVAPAFLLLFDTAEDLEKRMALLAELPLEIDAESASIELNRITLLETTGRMEEALETATRALARFRRIGLARSAAHCALISLCARAALGLDLERTAAEGRRLPLLDSPAFRRNVGIYLTEIGLLAGALEWTRAMLAELQPGEALYWPEGQILLGLDEGDLAARLDALDDLDETGPALRTLAALQLGAGDLRAAEASAAELLARPLLRIDDLLTLHASLSLIHAIGPERFGDPLRKEIRRRITGALEWLAERRTPLFISPLLDRYPGMLTPKEESAWRSRIRTMVGDRAESQRSEAAGKLRLGMLGTISVGAPGEEMRPLRGSRVRTMLGLLVAARMVKKPLTHREFCRLAAGGEQEPELARKTANMAVVRLREAIGVEAIVTGEETHLLNLERVQVDLLEAHAQLNEAIDALRRRALMKAFPAIIQALEITRGEVPFPGLYDEFFEALREDFEFRLRAAAIDVARALMRESDMASAGEILRRAFEGMPDDEEIADLLRDALAAVGMRADAERVRMKVEQELDE